MVLPNCLLPDVWLDPTSPDPRRAPIIHPMHILQRHRLRDQAALPSSSAFRNTLTRPTSGQCARPPRVFRLSYRPVQPTPLLPVWWMKSLRQHDVSVFVLELLLLQLRSLSWCEFPNWLRLDEGILRDPREESVSEPGVVHTYRIRW